MKDFEKIYKEEGAYHVKRKGFDKWWLDDNYSLIAAQIKNPSAVVLDLACGDGKLCEFISNPLIGVDYSPTSIKLNRKFYKNRYKKLIVGDMREMEKIANEIGKVDIIVCSLSFMYLIPKDLEMCLTELKKILNKDGKIIFTYPNVSRYRTANKTSAEIDYPSLKEIFIKAGFRKIERINICPLMPKVVVELSRTVLFPLAKLYYIINKILTNKKDDKAYHYLVKASYE